MPTTIEPRCSCGQTFPDTRYEVEEERVCLSCYEDSSGECRNCSMRFFTDNLTYIEDIDRDLCSSCYEDRGCFTCDDCGNTYSEDRYASNGYCTNCRSDDTDDEDSEPVEDTSGQSQEQGKVIKSLRRFGIELETVYNKTDAITRMRYLMPSWKLQGDGSIRTNKDALNGVEIVSPILQGKAGEDKILEISAKARGFGYFVNTSCGYHLHLEALDFKRDPKDDRKSTDEAIPDHRIEYRFTNHGLALVIDRLENLPTLENGELVPYEAVAVKNTDKKDVITNTGNNFYRLRELWYVYTLFDDVFRAMQPPSRRNNTFCRATSSLYSLETIKDTQDFNELEIAWYRIDKRLKLENRLMEARSRKNHLKDSTRYCGFNLAPILSNEGKTIELRYHSPTLNAEKILRWIDMHQTIFERVAEGNYPVDMLETIQARETNVVKKALAMCQLFKIRNDTKKYIMERLAKFNKINVSDEEMQDEEVSESEIGQPSHGGNGLTLRRVSRSSMTYGVDPDFFINQITTMRNELIDPNSTSNQN